MQNVRNVFWKNSNATKFSLSITCNGIIPKFHQSFFLANPAKDLGRFTKWAFMIDQGEWSQLNFMITLTVSFHTVVISISSNINHQHAHIAHIGLCPLSCALAQNDTGENVEDSYHWGEGIAPGRHHKGGISTTLYSPVHFHWSNNRTL